MLKCNPFILRVILIITFALLLMNNVINTVIKWSGLQI